MCAIGNIHSTRAHTHTHTSSRVCAHTHHHHHHPCIAQIHTNTLIYTMHHICTYTNIQTHPYIHATHTHQNIYIIHTKYMLMNIVHTYIHVPHTCSNKSSFIRSRVGIVLDSRRLPVPDTEATDRAHQQLACL